MTPPEEWRQVPSVPLLEASSWGRIRSVDRVQKMPNGGFRTRRLNPTYGQNSASNAKATHKRKIVIFCRKTYKVARLVCEAFHGPPPPGRRYVLHDDENAMNNRPENLGWGTQKENCNAPGFVAYCRSRTGENSPTRKGKARREQAAMFHVN